MKNFFLSAFMCMMAITTFAQTQVPFNASLPIYTSDANSSLQGVKQWLNGQTTTSWTRPGANASTLSKYIGAMALNPDSLAQVFFVDNSATPKLYILKKSTGTTGAEINTGQSFVGATAGTNGTTALPVINSESTFGINMMAIRKATSTGYAISKDNKLFSFSTVSPYAISSGDNIVDEAGNTVSFANAKGGGLMTNESNGLTALVNIPILGGYKPCIFSIDPVTKKAKFIKEVLFEFSGFDDYTMYVSGAGVALDGTVYTSLYSGVADNTLYKYDLQTNSFTSYLSTNSQVIGEITGAGQVKSSSGLLSVNFNELVGSFNAIEKATTIKWSVYADEPLSKYNLQSSADGNNFKTVATQTASTLNGQNSYKQIVNSTYNGLVYYRVAAVRTNNTEKYSTIITVDETNIVKANITTYPNPATYFFTLKLSEPKAVEEINIVDSRGATVAQIKIGGTIVNSKQINLEQYNLKNGQYFVKVLFTDSQRQSTLLTVQR